MATVAAGDAVVTLDGAGAVAFANEAGRALLADSAARGPLDALIGEARSAGAASMRLPAAGDRPALRVAAYAAGEAVTLIGTPAARPAADAAILDSIREIFLACDRDWRVTYVNARAEPYLEFLGMTRAEMIGRELWTTLPFLSGSEVHEAALRAVREQRDVEVEVKPGPFDRWFAVRITPTPDGAISYSRDITERKVAEERIGQLNRDLGRRVDELETLLEVIPIGIGIALAPDASDLRANPAFARMLGVPPEVRPSLTGPDADRVGYRVLKEGREVAPADLPMQRAARGERITAEEIEVVHQDGGAVTLLCFASPLFDRQDRARGAVGAFLDITVRRRQERAQAALAEASAVLNSSLDYARTLSTVARIAVPGLADYCLVDLITDTGEVERVEFAHVDRAKEERLRSTSLRHAPDPAWGGHPISRAMLAGVPTFVPDMTDAQLEVIAQNAAHLAYLRELAPRSIISAPLIAHGRTLGAITFCTAESGRRYTADDLALALNLADRAALAVVNARLYDAAQSELAQRAQAEADLRKWAHIFEHAGWGVAIVSADGFTLEAVNPAFAHLHGYEPGDLIGRPIDVVLGMPARQEARELYDAVRREGRRVFESVHLDRAGRELPVLMDLTAIRADDRSLLYFAANVHDLTERRRAEEHVRQAQKMEAVGRLAGGVAHDFNNMMMIIIGFADFLCHALEPDDPRRLDAEEIRKAAERAAGLTRQLLAFGRQQLVLPQLVDLNVVVRDMELMLRPLLGEDITLATSLPPVGSVRADRGQVEQVIMNLALNARDAMAGGGELLVETRSIELAEGDGYRQLGLEMPAGRYVRLTVRDSGLGMDAETRGRIFEPFFSTKPPAQNTGLGLSVVYGIVTQSGGYVAVDSAPGQGTTFTIWLPEVGAAADPTPDAAEAVVRGTGTILIVEDEPAVRSLAARVLSEAGYAVVPAASGREALERLATGAPVDAVLTDVVMPDMGGGELAEHLRELHPDLPILYMSGYTGTDVLRRGFDEQGVPFLQKPFSPGSLTAGIRRLLDGRAGRPVS
jgi:PAS domain S-box-containing protein